MSTIPFSEAYCRRHALSADRFERVVLARALYPHARLLAPAIRALWPEHFVADLDLVRGAGQLRRVRDFSIEAAEFSYHPANHRGLRQFLRLRISVQRLRRMVQETLHHPSILPPGVSARTEPPFTPAGAEQPTEAPGHP